MILLKIYFWLWTKTEFRSVDNQKEIVSRINDQIPLINQKEIVSRIDDHIPFNLKVG